MRQTSARSLPPQSGGWQRLGGLSRARCAEADMNGLPFFRSSDLQSDTRRVVEPIAAGVRQPPVGQSHVCAVVDHHSLARSRRGTPADSNSVERTASHDDLKSVPVLMSRPVFANKRGTAGASPVKAVPNAGPAALVGRATTPRTPGDRSPAGRRRCSRRSPRAPRDAVPHRRFE